MSDIVYSSHGLTTEALVATLVYSLLGLFIMLIAILMINKLFNLNMHRELVKEHNTAFGLLFGCMSIAIAIIIASTIVG